jgi:tight adherence protein C
VTSAVLLAAAAAVCAAAGVVELAAAAPRGRSPDADGSPVDRRRTAAAPRGILLRALARAGRALGVPAAPGDLEGRLAAAGLSARVTASEVMALKTGAALTALLGAVPVATALPGRLGVTVLAAAPCAAFLAPDAWLRRRVAARARTLALELADVLDLLRVAMGAGLPATRALAEVGRRHPGLLAVELSAVVARIELGVQRAEAIADLVARCPVPGIEALAAALDRADRHGTPLAPALAALAAQARADRARAVRERAARAAPKIQLAIALGLVPGVMLLVAAALLAALT